MKHAHQVVAVSRVHLEHIHRNGTAERVLCVTCMLITLHLRTAFDTFAYITEVKMLLGLN